MDTAATTGSDPVPSLHEFDTQLQRRITSIRGLAATLADQIHAEHDVAVQSVPQEIRQMSVLQFLACFVNTPPLPQSEQQETDSESAVESTLDALTATPTRVALYGTPRLKRTADASTSSTPAANRKRRRGNTKRPARAVREETPQESGGEDGGEHDSMLSDRVLRRQVSLSGPVTAIPLGEGRVFEFDAADSASQVLDTARLVEGLGDEERQLLRQQMEQLERHLNSLKQHL
ncbi:hypothetical protein RI367_002368 [Sorochytrium milnesiophthora]